MRTIIKDGYVVPHDTGFTNSTMLVRRTGKPHIALIGNWWRVSGWQGSVAISRVHAAHRFVSKLNRRCP